MARRPRIPADVELAILTGSARRCCLCYGLDGDFTEKKGQIAHLDEDNSNNDPGNLAFLCLDHHDSYDGRTSQSKNYTINEAKHYRSKLYAKVETGLFLSEQGLGHDRLEIVDLDFLESRDARLKAKDHSFYEIMKDSPKHLAGFEEWARDPCPKSGELPVLDVKLRNPTKRIAFLKRAVFEVRHAWPLVPFGIAFSEVTISKNYDVAFPASKPPYTVKQNVSQAIRANDVDRFTLTLYPAAIATILHVTLTLIYDADDKSVVAGDILFAIRGHDHPFETATKEKLAKVKDKRLREQYLTNNRALRAIKKIVAVKSNVVRAFESGTL